MSLPRPEGLWLATITAVASLVSASAALVSVLGNSRRLRRLGRKVDSVHQDVKTGNALSMGQLADAQESRRISEIPLDQQTDLEKSHVAEVEYPSKGRK